MTFDELTSIYRVETKSGAISEVRRDLYVAMVSLLESIHKEYQTQLAKDPGSIICEGVNERRKRINLISHQIVDRRMDKIARLALSGAMGADNSVDHLTDEEKEYYHSLLEHSRRHRSIIDGKTPPKATVFNVTSSESAVVIDAPKQIVEEIETGTVEMEEPQEEFEDILEEEHITIRILEDLPTFSGPDMDYDLKKEDVISMPAVMANALISREKAIRLDVTP